MEQGSIAKYLREHKTKSEDHGDKTTVKEIEIVKSTYKALLEEGGARGFVYRELKRAK